MVCVVNSNTSELETVVNELIYNDFINIKCTSTGSVHFSVTISKQVMQSSSYTNYVV